MRQLVLLIQAVTIKAIAEKIRDKYHTAPHAEARAWERRTAESIRKEEEARGLSQQKMPDSMPSLEFQRVWTARKADSETICVWRPIGPPGYVPLGDVISFGLDPPPNPVQVSFALHLFRVLLMDNPTALSSVTTSQNHPLQ